MLCVYLSFAQLYIPHTKPSFFFYKHQRNKHNITTSKVTWHHGTQFLCTRVCSIYNQDTTFNSGYLGSRIDEERSEMRYVVWIAEFRESSNFWTHIAPKVFRRHACLSVSDPLTILLLLVKTEVDWWSWLSYFDYKTSSLKSSDELRGNMNPCVANVVGCSQHDRSVSVGVVRTFFCVQRKKEFISVYFLCKLFEKIHFSILTSV